MLSQEQIASMTPEQVRELVAMATAAQKNIRAQQRAQEQKPVVCREKTEDGLEVIAFYSLGKRLNKEGKPSSFGRYRHTPAVWAKIFAHQDIITQAFQA